MRNRLVLTVACVVVVAVAAFLGGSWRTAQDGRPHTLVCWSSAPTLVQDKGQPPHYHPLVGPVDVLGSPHAAGGSSVDVRLSPGGEVVTLFLGEGATCVLQDAAAAAKAPPAPPAPAKAPPPPPQVSDAGPALPKAP